MGVNIVCPNNSNWAANTAVASTLIPLSLYLKEGKVKVALGLCRGKKNYDKRDSMLEKAHKRDMERALKERNR